MWMSLDGSEKSESSLVSDWVYRRESSRTLSAPRRCQRLGLPREEGCYAQQREEGGKRGRPRKGSSGKKRTKCKQCKSASNWDMEHQACWDCDADYFSEAMHVE